MLWYPVTNPPEANESLLMTNGNEVSTWQVNAKEIVAFPAVCQARGFTHWCYVKDLMTTIYQL